MFPRVKDTIVFTLRGRGPPITRVFTFFVFIVFIFWFCIRASHAKMKGLRHFIPRMEIKVKIDL